LFSCGSFDATLVSLPSPLPVLVAVFSDWRGDEACSAAAGAIAGDGAGTGATSAGTGAITIGGARVPDGGIAAVVTGVEIDAAAASGAVATDGTAAGAGSDAVTGGTSGTVADTGAGALAGALASVGGAGAGALTSAGAAGASALACEGAAGAGALASAGAAGAAGAGALASAGAAGAGALASGGAVTGGALASAGAAGADDDAPDVVEPGTPPVTLIESPLMSSLDAGCAAGADALLPLSRRIEFPTVPEPIAGTDDGDDIGVLTPSWARAAGDTSAIATIAIATILAKRLTLFCFFTISRRRKFSLNLLMKFKYSRLGMSTHAETGHAQPFAENGNHPRRFDLIFVGHERGRIGAENIIAKVDDRSSTQKRARHMIPIHSQKRARCIDDHRLSVARSHRDFRVGQLQRSLVG
jgi:hypothetical protein